MSVIAAVSGKVILDGGKSLTCGEGRRTVFIRPAVLWNHCRKNLLSLSHLCFLISGFPSWHQLFFWHYPAPPTFDLVTKGACPFHLLLILSSVLIWLLWTFAALSGGDPLPAASPFTYIFEECFCFFIFPSSNLPKVWRKWKDWEEQKKKVREKERAEIF